MLGSVVGLAVVTGCADPAEAASRRFISDLHYEINARRTVIGRPPVELADSKFNNAVSRYLTDLTPLMIDIGACFHGMHTRSLRVGIM